jgi:hypothetical protein
MKRWVTLGLIALLALFGSGAVLAQDVVVGQNVGDITGDPGSFYGQTVTLQGNISDFLSTNVFVLSDASAVNANVLVINNSGQPLPNSYVQGQDIIVSGRIHPSYSEVLGGAIAQFPSFFEERQGMMGGMMATQDPAMMATQDPAMMATQDPAMMATPDLSGTPLGGATDPMATPASADAGASTGATPADTTMVTPVGGTGDTSVSGTMTDMSGQMTGMMMSYQEDLLAFVYGDSLMDEYDIYTILEITDINQLMYPSDVGQ